MDDEKDIKKNLGYKPDIQYIDDYYSDKAYREKYHSTIDDNDDDDDDIYDEEFMDSLQDDIDHLVDLIPMFPIEIQTAINQVFKPIFNDWYDNIKGRLYPTKIPDPDKVIIRPGDTITGGTGGGGTTDEGGDFDDYQPGGNNGRDFDDEPVIDPRPPVIFTPDPQEPVIPDPLPVIVPEYIGDDNIFEPSTPFIIEPVEYDPIEKLEMEYTKNIADLYNYYLNKLQNALNRFYLALVNAIYKSNKETGRTDCAQFIIEDIQLADTEVEGGLRHLIDAGLRGEVTGSLKLSFCINNFSLESTLYHMKDFKVAKELRTRYEMEEMMKDGTHDGAISDRMLEGMRNTYDKKYDTAYINLYKYLNSSVDVLEDVLNTLILGVRAKEILLKKGGTSE
jgi:hypothetical protein